jgi:hypothetical protein
MYIFIVYHLILYNFDSFVCTWCTCSMQYTVWNCKIDKATEYNIKFAWICSSFTAYKTNLHDFAIFFYSTVHVICIDFTISNSVQICFVCSKRTANSCKFNIVFSGFIQESVIEHSKHYFVYWKIIKIILITKSKSNFFFLNNNY